MFRAIAKVMGFPGLSAAEFPGVIPLETVESLAAKTTASLAPDAIRRLAPVAESTPMREQSAPSLSMRTPVFRGGLSEIQEFFGEHQWTDGLPVIPPTIKRVEEALRYTPRDPDEVLGVLRPELRQATVWNVAVNGVMAGCRPEYLPVLIAAVEAFADPVFRQQDGGSTPSWEPMIIVSGPGAKRLKFTSGPGALKVGTQANTSIGRFMRMYMRNVAGFRTAPGGDTDKGSIGFTFNVALAENDDAIRQLGWEPWRVERGFADDDTTVTVQSILGTGGPLYSSGSTASEHMEAIIQIAGSTCGGFTSVGVRFDAWHPLLVLNPSVAEIFKRENISKDDIRQWLYRDTKVPARWFNRTLRDVGIAFTLEEMVAAGSASPVYAESDDPNRPVPVFLRPEWIGIVVAGDPARNQSRFLMQNQMQGVPTTRKVDFL